MMKRTLAVFGISFIAFSLSALWLLRTDRFFGEQPLQAPIEVEAVEFGESASLLRLTITQDGIVALSEQDIERARLPFSDFSAESLALSRDGTLIPFHIDSRNEDNETLYFYAEAITDTLAAPAVYLLENAPGVAMRTRSAQPTGPGVTTGERQQRWEENRTFLAAANRFDPWLGALIYAPNSVEMMLADIEPAVNSALSPPAQITARLWSNNQSAADPDHHLRVSLNNTPLLDKFWDGITSVTLDTTVAPAVLSSSENILELSAPGDIGAAGEAIYVDWIELIYEGELLLRGAPLRFRSAADNLSVRGATDSTLVFDVSNPSDPALLLDLQNDETGISFASEGLASDYLILDPNQALQPNINAMRDWGTPLREIPPADYIAIVANFGRFSPALQPLVELRETQGLSVASVPLAQIYDEFAFGRQTPQAIRDFLTYAEQTWQQAPRFVLLVGDASYDFNRFTGGENINLLPSYLEYSDYAGFVASDLWFVMGNDAAAPTMAVGRFPVQTLEELEISVRKTVSYESAENPSWRSRSLLVADDELYFDAASDELALALASNGFANQKLYMSQNEQIRDAIIGAINQGVGILNYAGHGGIRVWGDERILSVEDAPTLTNRSRLPIFTTFSCLNGYFDHPQDDALAEALLFAPTGGIVAAVAPSGRSLRSQQIPINDSFYTTYLSGQQPTLGETLLTAKRSHLSDPFLDNAVHTFNLLGDPALTIFLPETTSR